MNQVIGKWMLLAGIFLLIAGAVVYFFGNKLNWLGNLPGDVKIERDNFKFYFPITTMILLSVALSLLLRLLRKLM